MSNQVAPDVFTKLTDGVIVQRASNTVAADADIFTIDGGLILFKGLVGRVTVAIGSGSEDIAIAFDPDDGGSNVALASLVACDADVTDTFYTLNTTFGGALVATLDYAPNFPLGAPYVLPEGDIVMDVTGTEAGEVQWTACYVPITVGATLTAV